MNKRVFNLIANVLSVSADTITIDSSPDTVEKWDSLKHMNIIIALEQEFNVQFDEEQLAYLENVELIIESLKELGCS